MTPSVGIDVGGTTIKAVRWTDEGTGGRVEARRQEPTPDSPDQMLECIGDLVGELGSELPVGVGLAGLVDSRRGVLVWAPHLSGVEVDVSGPLEARLGRPLLVDNDANFAALAEVSLERPLPGSAVMLTLGTGIGMGIVIGGQIYRGRAHAGEAGHVTVDSAGTLCECGRAGCWETVVSGRRLDADAAEVLGPGSTGADLVVAAGSGHPAARRRLNAALGWLAGGIEAIVLVLDPDLVILGGAMAEAGDVLLQPVRARLAGTEGAGHRAATTVRTSILGPGAGAIGAAIAAGRAAEGMK